MFVGIFAINPMWFGMLQIYTFRSRQCARCANAIFLFLCMHKMACRRLKLTLLQVTRKLSDVHSWDEQPYKATPALDNCH